MATKPIYGPLIYENRDISLLRFGAPQQSIEKYVPIRLHSKDYEALSYLREESTGWLIISELIREQEYSIIIIVALSIAFSDPWIIFPPVAKFHDVC